MVKRGHVRNPSELHYPGRRAEMVLCMQIDLRSDYERKQDGLGLLVKNANISRVHRLKGAATLEVSLAISVCMLHQHSLSCTQIDDTHLCTCAG